MPAYSYRGLDLRGKAVSGVCEADSARSLRGTLRKDGVFVTDIHEAHEKKAHGKGLQREVHFKSLFDRISPQDVAIVTRQLATLLSAGIPLAEALLAVVEQSSSERFGGALANVRTRVNEGMTLGDSLASHPEIFGDLYINMVRAGEAAGNLDQVLVRLADLLDAQVRLRGKIRGALAYPVVMAGVAVLVTGMLMVFVVPKITQIFADTGKALPWNTRLLIWASDIAGGYWWAILIALIGGIYGFRRWKRSAGGRATWDRIILRIWQVGPLVRMVAIARFARTLGSMLASGVPLLQTLEISKAIVGNAVLVDVIERAKEAIREGESIADPLRKSGQFPPVVTRMIAVGERSGQLEGMLRTVAESYESEVDLQVNRFTTLMEPLIILVMGGVVGFIVFSILLPILDMNEMIG